MGVASAINSCVRWRTLHENDYVCKGISTAPGTWQYIRISMNYVIDVSFQSLYHGPMQPHALLTQGSEVPPTPLQQLLRKMT